MKLDLNKPILVLSATYRDYVRWKEYVDNETKDTSRKVTTIYIYDINSLKGTNEEEYELWLLAGWHKHPNLDRIMPYLASKFSEVLKRYGDVIPE